MVKVDEIILRRYKEKQCVQFTYELRLDESTGEALALRFRRDVGSEVWTMELTYPRTVYAESQRYEFLIATYKPTMPLERVAEFGLAALAEALTHESSKKQQIVYHASEAIR